MGSKGSGSAPSPDPNIGKAALKQAEIGESWLGFAKDAFKVNTERQGKLDELTTKVANQQLGIGDYALATAKKDRDRLETKGWAAQDEFAKEAGEYGSAANVQKARADAGADTQAAAAAAREQATRESAAMGIRPGSGRDQGTRRAGELGTAMAVGGAMNTAGNQRKDKALALKADVANMYTGNQAAQAAAGVGQALSAGSGAVGMHQNTNQIAQSNANVMNQGFSGAMTGWGNSANTLLNKYGLDLDRWKTQQETSSANIGGIFSALGSFAGLAAVSDPKTKENVKAVKKGEGIAALKKIPIKEFDYKPGKGDGGHHIGAMADKFAKATGLPDTGVIRFQDAIGITMKAVQDLDDKLEKVSRKVGIKPASQPKPRRESQSPANARTPAKVSMKIAKPAVTPQVYGIRR